MGAIDTVVPSMETEVIESPNVDTADTVETPVEESAEVETAESPTLETETDGRAMSPQLKSFLKELSATNPKLSASIRNNFMEHRAFREEFPQGLKEVR